MNIDFSKNSDKLVPAIIVDASTQKVLMLGYMNNEATPRPLVVVRLLFLADQKTGCGPKEKKVVIF